jgi:hypothetical protein
MRPRTASRTIAHDAVDSEFAGILIAVGFLLMGAVGLDIGRGFILGALGLGVVVAFLFRFLY